jgi:cytochrome P450 family 142 subfamily A polypeptide 1
MTTTKPDVDLTDGDFYAGDSRSVYRWMRENEPVFRDRNGLAAAATYTAVIEAERNPELFSNVGGIRPDQPGVEMMIEMDDPQHLLRRKLVNAGFTRKRVKDLDGSIVSLCDTLIDAVCERGECDFVWDLAAPLPMAVIGDMLGVRPEEREMFLKWSDDLLSAEQYCGRRGYAGHDGCLRGLQRVHERHDRRAQEGVDRRSGQRPGAR